MVTKSMHDKIALVRQLLELGYVMTEVGSERGWVEATFRLGGERVVVRFTLTEAEALLRTPTWT